MNKNSNSYIFIYASIMVVLVAVILTSANLALKPLQEKNKQNEKMINLLRVIGIEANAENSAELYDQYLVKEVIIDGEGNESSIYAKGAFEIGKTRAFNVNLKSALNDVNKNGITAMPMYVMENAGEKFYIIPVFGKGLWGPVYGNVALKEDKNTVAAVSFGHDAETPGLGAEIVDAPFTSMFIGKQIFNNGEFVSVAVVKGGVANQNKVAMENGVDAISGSTLTCNGVSDMIEDCMVNYVNYLKKDN